MWSGDSTATPDELAAAVEEAAVDVVCITDHSTIAGALALGNELSCSVVVGQEQRTPEGEIIGLFLTERIPAGCRSASEAASAIRQQGGLVYVPHPDDPSRHGLPAVVIERLADEGLLDIVEVFNAKSSGPLLGDRAERLRVRLGAAAGAGSDAHVADAIGAALVEMSDFSGAQAFLRGLTGARVIGHRYDPARTWRPRVVPPLP